MVGYAFFDFSLATDLTGTFTSNDIDVDQTKAILKQAISDTLFIDDTLVTISQLYLGSKTAGNELTGSTRRLRHLQSTTKLIADSTIGVDVSADDEAAAGSLAEAAKARYLVMSSALETSVTSGTLNTNVQAAATSLYSSSVPLASSVLDTAETALSSNDFRYGTSPDSSLSVLYTQSSSGNEMSKGSAIGIGIGVGLGAIVIGAVAGGYYFHKKNRVGSSARR